MSKREAARARKAAWQKALAEGRVVRVSETTLRECQTAAEAHALAKSLGTWVIKVA